MERTGWLYHVPPWRMPRIRTHHYHHGHHTERIPPVRWALAAYLFALIWWFELEAWLVVWLYYGAFLALRWCWRHNPIGQTIDTRQAARERQQPPAVTPTEYIDLGRLSD